MAYMQSFSWFVRIAHVVFRTFVVRVLYSAMALGGCASVQHAHTWIGSDLSLHGKPWVPGSIPRSLVFLEPARAGPRGCCPWSALTLAVLGGCLRAGMGGYKPCNFVT